MAKETLSATEANRIIEEANNIMAGVVDRMEDKSDAFVKKVSTIWEDKNAVDYMKEHKQNFESFVTELSGNNKIFAERVREIAEVYIKKGNMSDKVTATAANLSGNFNVDAVKEHFANGDKADEFGFQNPSSGASQVMDAFTELKTALSKDAQTAISQVKSINAFGNTQVSLNLAESAGKIVEILNEHVTKAESQIRDYVDQTAQAYVNIGSSAETSAKISSE